jgi:hypothetical protein
VSKGRFLLSLRQQVPANMHRLPLTRFLPLEEHGRKPGNQSIVDQASNVNCPLGVDPKVLVGNDQSYEVLLAALF